MLAEDGLRQHLWLGRLLFQHPWGDPQAGSGRSDHRDRTSRAVREANHFELYTAEGMERIVDDDTNSRERGILTG